MLRRRAPRRDTGPQFWVKQEVQARWGGRCARCGGPGSNIHHRQPRRMGGSRDPRVNGPANLLWLCGTGTTRCHGWIESHRDAAREAGWLLRDGQDPAAVPVLLWDGRRVLLDDDGGQRPAPA